MVAPADHAAAPLRLGGLDRHQLDRLMIDNPARLLPSVRSSPTQGLRVDPTHRGDAEEVPAQFGQELAQLVDDSEELRRALRCRNEIGHLAGVRGADDDGGDRGVTEQIADRQRREIAGVRRGEGIETAQHLEVGR